MAGFELSSILSDALKLQGAQTQQASQQANLLNEAADLSGKQAVLISDAGKLTSEAALVELQGQLQTQKQRVTAANAFGTNIGDVSDIITSLGQDLRNQALALTEAQNEVTKIESESDLLTNPIGWLKDLVGGDAARAKRDALAAQFDTTQKLANSLNTSTQATVQTQNAITETLSAASIKQTADAKAKLAEADALNANIQGKKYGADAIGVMREVGASNFNTSVRAYQIATDDARWKEGFALRQAQFEALQEDRKLRKDAKQYYTDATTQINTYRERVGLPPVTEQQVTQRLDRGDEIGQEMRKQQVSGWRISERGEGNLFGDSPAATMARLSTERPQLPASYNQAGSVYAAATAEYQTRLKAAEIDPQSEGLLKDPAYKARLFDESFAAIVAKSQSDIKHGTGNPYQALPIQTILEETSNGIAETPFGKKVLQTLVSTGQADPTPDILVASAVSAVQAGEISINDARKGIVDFYESSNAIKNSTGGFLQLGVPVQDTYNTRLEITTPGFLDRWAKMREGNVYMDLPSPLEIRLDPSRAGERTPVGVVGVIDLTDPAQVTTVLTIAQSQKRAAELLEQARAKNQ